MAARVVMSSPLTARIVLAIVCLLAVVMCADVAYAATHHRVETRIDCALVLTRESGPECR